MKYLLISLICVLTFTACGSEPVVYEVEIDVSKKYERCVEFITAFLNHDTDKIEELTFSEKGMFKDYEKLTFGDYEVLPDPDDGEYGTRLYFNFEIIKSGLDTFPKGKYETFVEDGFHSTVLMVLNKNDEPKKFAPIDNWFKTCASYIITPDTIAEMNDTMRSDISETLLSFLPESYEGYTLEEIQSAAELYYSIKNFIPGGVVSDYYEGLYIVGGHGGDIWIYDITDVTDTTATLQFYADYMGTIKSHLIMYTLTEVNGQLVINDCVIWEQSKYEPYHRSV